MNNTVEMYTLCTKTGVRSFFSVGKEKILFKTLKISKKSGAAIGYKKSRLIFRSSARGLEIFRKYRIFSFFATV